VYFSDVVFADVFTSFAKVLGDVWLSLCMLLPGGSLLSPPPLDGLSQWILPTLMRYAAPLSVHSCAHMSQPTVYHSLPPVFNRTPVSYQHQQATPLECTQIRVLFSGDIPFCRPKNCGAGARRREG
jgi:hypothetical protein